MKQSIFYLSDVSLKLYQIHKFRGFVGNLFKDYDIIHNHDPITGKSIYRYPLIQFKTINKQPAIVAITDEAVNLFSILFMKLDNIVIEDIEIPIYEKNLIINNADFGFSQKKFTYEFISPWIALNQKNYNNYRNKQNQNDKRIILQRALIGNILSMSKYLNYWLDKEQNIEVDLNVNETKVNLKGKTMIGFIGHFKTNFKIPDYLGIGKSVSRGFGIVKKIH